MPEILPGWPPRQSGKKPHVQSPDQPDEPDEPDETPSPAEDRTTEEAAGAAAGDRDLDELLDDPDPASA